MKSAALVLLALAVLPQARSDRIVKIDGTAITDCRVTAWNFREIRFSVGGRDQTLPAEQVASASIAAVRQAFERAYSHLEQGQEGQAFELFLQQANRLVTQARGGVVPFTAQFGFWEAIQIRLGDPDGAAEAFRLMDELVRQIPETRFLPDVYRARFEHHLARGDKEDLARARQAAERFATAVHEKGMPSVYAKEAEFNGIWVRWLAGDLQPDAAREEFSSFLRSVEREHHLLADRARVELGMSLVQERGLDQARGYFDAVLQRNEKAGTVVDPDTVARAYLGRAHTFFLKPDRGPEDLREALLDYLRLHAHFPEAHPETVGEALFHAAIAMDLWSTAETKTQDVRRIRSVLRLDPRWRNTSWAERAAR